VHLLHLIEEFLLLLVAARGVNDDDFVLLFPKELYTLLCDLDGVSLFLMAKEGALDLGSVLFELVKGTSAKGICAD